MQVTQGTKNQAPRSWRQEGTQQSQAYNNRIPTASTFYHLPCIYMKYSDGQYFEPPQVNKGDAAEKFLEQVLASTTICRQHLANNIPMKQLTQEQWREYNNTTNCSIYTKPFKSVDKKVRDSDHLTGEYRGPVHIACNLNFCFHTIFCLISKLFTLG